MGMLLAFSTCTSYGSFSMQLVADNDFAVFGGTATSVTSLLYQNDKTWPTQISTLFSHTFDLGSGQTTFYILGMGGGGYENISGTVNGVDLPNIAGVLMSSDIAGSLTDYFDSKSGTAPSVADGTYNASLADVQTVFSTLTWGDTVATTGADAVVELAAASPSLSGFHFDDLTAHLFKFSATSAGVPNGPEISAVPEITSTFSLFGLIASGLMLRRRGRISY